MAEQDLQRLSQSINDLLANTTLDDVTSEYSSGFQELPEGYYLTEVKTAELRESKESKLPMVAITLRTVEDGKTIKTNPDTGDAELVSVPKTSNRSTSLYYVLKDQKSVKRFVSDMLKFEGEEEGAPILEKQYFTSFDLLNDALDILVGLRIYIQITESKKEDGSSNIWKNLISWKRAKILELE